MITRGIQAEGDIFVAKVLAAVKAFDAFTADNDPHGEHDFGALEIDGIRVFWKLDLYDPTLSFGSEDPDRRAPHLPCAHGRARLAPVDL